VVRSGGDVTANAGAVGVVSKASEPPVRGGFAKVAGISIDGGGGCLRDERNSDSKRDGRFPNDAPLWELLCSPVRELWWRRCSCSFLASSAFSRHLSTTLM
jgi:hypothetical protein